MSERDKVEFQVLDPIDYPPGTYMFKDGQYVPYDGSDVNGVMVIKALKETTDER